MNQHIETERRYHFEFTGSDAFMRKYQKVATLLSNRLKGRVRIEAVLEALLDEHIERHDPVMRARRRARRATRLDAPGATHSGAGSASPKPSRHVPAPVRDQVTVRDGGRCTFVGPDQNRCDAIRNLHVDHITPFAWGGSHDPSNLRLLCFTHNQLMAERSFGAPHMAKFRNGG